MDEGSEQVLAYLLVPLVCAVTFGAPASVQAESSESRGSRAAESTDDSRAAARTEPRRGSLAAEIGGGTAGWVLGALPPLAMTFGALEFLGTGAGTLPVGFVSTALGSYAGSGLGAGLAGNGSGGEGKIGFAILGSTIGGVGVAAPALALGIAGDAPITGLFVVAIFSPVGAIAGGVTGYRMSAPEPQAGSDRPAVSVTPGWRAIGGEQVPMLKVSGRF